MIASKLKSPNEMNEYSFAYLIFFKFDHILAFNTKIANIDRYLFRPFQ